MFILDGVCSIFISKPLFTYINKEKGRSKILIIYINNKTMVYTKKVSTIVFRVTPKKLGVTQFALYIYLH